MTRPEGVREPPRELEVDESVHAARLRRVGALLELRRRVRTVPRRRIDQAKRTDPLRIRSGKSLSDVAAHRAPGNRGALPSHVIKELAEIARKELRRVCPGAARCHSG